MPVERYALLPHLARFETGAPDGTQLVVEQGVPFETDDPALQAILDEQPHAVGRLDAKGQLVGVTPIEGEITAEAVRLAAQDALLARAERLRSERA